MIHPLSITSTDLKQKKYLDVFPEYYELETVIENNDWHNHQNVFDHVTAVFKGLEEVLQFKQFPAQQKKVFERHLSKTIGKRTRKELLIVATLLHDIAKPETFIQKIDGTTECPNHELIASREVKKYSSLFRLDSLDEKYVEKMIKYHGQMFNSVFLILQNGGKQKNLELFQQTAGDVHVELLLLMYADVLGSDLEKNDPTLFEQIQATLSWMLKKVLSPSLEKFS